MKNMLAGAVLGVAALGANAQTQKAPDRLTIPVGEVTATIISDDYLGSGGAVRAVAGNEKQAVSLLLQKQKYATYGTVDVAQKLTSNILVSASVRQAREDAFQDGNTLTGTEVAVELTGANIGPMRELSVGAYTGKTNTKHLGSTQEKHETRYSVDTPTNISEYAERWTTTTNRYAYGQSWHGGSARATADIGDNTEIIGSLRKSSDAQNIALTARQYHGTGNVAITYEQDKMSGSSKKIDRVGLAVQQVVAHGVVFAAGVKYATHDAASRTTAYAGLVWTPGTAKQVIGQRPTATNTLDAKAYLGREGGQILQELGNKVRYGSETSESPKEKVLLSQFEKPKPSETSNTAPSAVKFTPSAILIAEKLVEGQIVGQLSCTDVAPTGAQNTCTYTGGNSNFAVSTGGSITLLNIGLTEGTYPVSVIATDAGGLTKSGPVSVKIENKCYGLTGQALVDCEG